MTEVSGSQSQSLAHGYIAALGIVTICVYGAWYYAFGVLLDPIIDDTGWDEGALAFAFSLGLFGIGIGSVLGGRLLDRFGTRVVFTLAAVVGGGSIFLATLVSRIWLFVPLSALGMGVLGALGFYHITMAAAVRLHPDNSDRAIATLTIWGALASPIFLPLSAWLVQSQGWRATSRWLVLAAVLSLLVAAVWLPGHQSTPGERPRLGQVFRSAVATPAARAFTGAVALIGMTISLILAYQVPIMTAAGLPLATAASMAGARGFAQLGGRIPLGFLVGRLGAHRSLLVALWAIAFSTLILAVSGVVVVALTFAVVAGFGIGAYSPLQGMYSAELFDRGGLGASMGMYSSISMLAGSIGPAVGGQLAGLTGDRRWVALLAALTAMASVLVFASTRATASRDAQQ